MAHPFSVEVFQPTIARQSSAYHGDCRCCRLYCYSVPCFSFRSLPDGWVSEKQDYKCNGTEGVLTYATARKDRWEDCHAVLTLVHGKGNANSPLVTQELSDIREMCEFEARNADVTYWELFKPRYINRTHIGIFTQIWSQLTGMVRVSKQKVGREHMLT